MKSKLLSLALFFAVFLQGFGFAQEFKQDVAFSIPVNDGKAIAFFVSQTKLAIVYVKGENIVVSFKTLCDVEPNPNPSPDPNPNPSPLFVTHIYWVEESLNRTPEQAKIISSQKVREALKKKSIRFQVVDKDIKNEFDQTPSNLVPILSKVTQYPSLVLVTKDSQVLVYSVPESEEDFVEFLESLQ